MLMNHLEQNKRLASALSTLIQAIPDGWELGYKPDWMWSITAMCESLKADTTTVCEEANKIRTLVGMARFERPCISDLTDMTQTIDLHGVSQSRSISYLTFLAAFFVPISAVSVRFNNRAMFGGLH
jgi:hypothetical protein